MRSFTPPNVALIPEYAQKVFSGVIFDVYQWDQELFDGSTETFEMVKRADTVEILAIHDEKIILTKEQQPHTDEYISIPAGRHDYEAEHELAAAKRELLEETGYSFKNWKLIEARQAGSGKVEHIIYTFLATELESITEQKLDAGEKIEVLEMPFAEFKEAECMEGMRFYPTTIMGNISTLEELLALPSCTLMETKSDTSYGVIPFIKDGEAWQVFLIEEISWTGNIFWTFPKGHPNEGESPEAAAERELLEETGLTLAKLYPEKQLTQSYQFTHEGVRINKTVTYFLGIAANQNFTPQEGEVKDAGWFGLETARERLTHDSAKKLLDQAIALL